MWHQRQQGEDRWTRVGERLPGGLQELRQAAVWILGRTGRLCVEERLYFTRRDKLLALWFVLDVHTAKLKCCTRSQEACDLFGFVYWYYDTCRSNRVKGVFRESWGLVFLSALAKGRNHHKAPHLRVVNTATNRGPVTEAFINAKPIKQNPDATFGAKVTLLLLPQHTQCPSPEKAIISLCFVGDASCMYIDIFVVAHPVHPCVHLPGWRCFIARIRATTEGKSRRRFHQGEEPASFTDTGGSACYTRARLLPPESSTSFEQMSCMPEIGTPTFLRMYHTIR